VKYRKTKAIKLAEARPTETKQHDWILGMLYIVHLRLRNRAGEKIKHRILMVGCEAADIERKLKWSFDMSRFDEFSITAIEKVKEKIHIISTVIEQQSEQPTVVIERDERSQLVGAPSANVQAYDPKLFAIGVVTTMKALDQEHALRKVGRALVNSSIGKSHDGPSLSPESTITVEEIAFPSGYATPRDVVNESNEATFVRG